MSEAVQFIFFLVFFIGGLVLYHSVFDVVYLNLGKGLLSEIISAALLSCLMVFITMKFWIVSVILILLVGLGVSSKFKNDSTRGAFIIFVIIFAIIVGISGYKFNHIDDKNGSEEYSNVSVHVMQVENVNRCLS